VLRENVEPDIVTVVEDLYEWAEDTADRVWFGTGAETGSFTFHYLREGKTISVFTIFTNGKLQLNYGWLSEQISTGVLEQFHHRISEIPTFRRIPADFSKWPNLEIVDAFRGPGEIQEFKQAVEWLGDKVGSIM